jgi:diguanylate cyclase (GGDEF)-like protein
MVPEPMADFSHSEFMPAPLPVQSGVHLSPLSGEGAADDDPLTGLATRRRLIERLGQLMSHPSSETHPPGLVLLDLDRFKTMNDGLGPLICDKLLCRVAARLRSVVPDAALLARISGDGFAVLLDDGRAAPSVATQLLDFMGRPYAVGGHAITMGASIGVAVAQPGRENDLSVFHSADLALHQAQHDGRDRIRFYDPSMQERAFGRRSLESDFRESIGLQHVELCRALKSQQFEVHYQPQVALADGRLTGFEALLRWNHPERGLVMPDRFIPLAEETGLIDLLGEWVLRTACREAAAWPVPDTGIPLRIAVNISPMQLREGRALLEMIENALRESDLPVDRLEFELTETALAGDIGDTLSDIRALGADLALDDFGTGYSSLSRLHCHPFNRLKIDRSFVTDLGLEEDCKAQQTSEWMVRAIASLGLGLGLETVIEGIETPHQRDVARLAGCTEMQGYLVSRPVRDTELADLVSRLAPPLQRKDPD